MDIDNGLKINDTFFGRTKELDFLHKKVSDLKKEYRHNVAILGKRLSGKSRLLLNFLSSLDKTDIAPIYVDLSILSYAAFIDQFIGMLLNYHYEGKRQIGQDLHLFIDTISADLPKTHKKIKSIYSHVKSGKLDAAFAELLSLPGCFSQETGKLCLVIIDNFEEFAGYGLNQPFSVLGDSIMLQKASLYMLCGRPNANSKNILSEKLSLLFGKFQTLELEPFSCLESMDFIESRCANITLSDDIKKLLIAFTDSEPFYLNILTDFIAVRCKNSGMQKITSEDFNYILCNAMLSPHSPINQYFSRIMETLSGISDSKTCLKVFNAMLSENKLSSIAVKSRHSKDGVRRLLDGLIGCEIAVKNGPLYTIEDEMFKVWLMLKEVETAPRFSLDQYADAEKLIAKVREITEGFVREQQRQIDDKIFNLISSFDNEKITVGNRTHVLPMFKHINTEITTKEHVLLSAHGSKMWVFSVFKKTADEDDIADFLARCRQAKHRVSRKILILLNGITPEAKLLAMEERMWLWPIDKLNNLLNLYGKNKIIYENSSIG
ncbi:MAG: ATP-binding protein [Candidatus Omnitrophica bacterium]|nr:ATP-binding protein [Candidatus Omnitrophota bacterium]